MTTQVFTAPGTLAHVHPGGKLAIQATGGKGGVLAMFKPTNATNFRVLQGDNGQRVVNRDHVDIPPGDVEVTIADYSGVSVAHPIEIDIQSF